MGFLSGNLSLKRFYIEDIGIFKDKDKVLANMENFCFKDIEDEAAEESIGWVSPGKIYKTAIEAEEVFFGNYVLLALRYDTKKVSKTLVEFKAEKIIEAEGLKFTNNRELKRFKDDIKRELLKKSLPTPKVIEAVIDLNKSTLFLNSVSKKTGALFLSLFEKTFAIMPIYVDNTVFCHIAVGSGGVEKLSSLTETVIYDE